MLVLCFLQSTCFEREKIDIEIMIKRGGGKIDPKLNVRLAALGVDLS